jgi:hypothetical protein
MKELCTELGALARSHDAWVRLHYVYPYPSVDEILPMMADGSILPYLDVPFQHAHPAVLKAMKRPASGEKNIERIAGWRAICPDLTIRSTFITGFPGETEEQFQYLLDFLQEARLDRVGCFAYSPVEGRRRKPVAGRGAGSRPRGTPGAPDGAAGRYQFRNACSATSAGACGCWSTTKRGRPKAQSASWPDPPPDAPGNRRPGGGDGRPRSEGPWSSR